MDSGDQSGTDPGDQSGTDPGDQSGTDPGEQSGTDPGDRAAAPVVGSITLLPSLREHLPSLVFGAAVPIGIYFVVRRHLLTDAQALIVAGCFSVGWILVQFVRHRRVDFLGAVVLLGFVVSVVTSTLLGGNAYVLKVRDAAFSALFGVVCIVTVYTHDRPVLFYVSRYLSAGTDPARVSAFDRLHEVPNGRRTFRVLSVVWGVGLVVEASLRMTLAEVLHTGTFLAVTPFITAVIIGGLFVFTALYSRQAQEAAALGLVPAAIPVAAGPEVAVRHSTGVEVAGVDVAPGTGYPQVPFP